MRWGISFNVPATYESDLWVLPPPSQVETATGKDGEKYTIILYHFLYAPQSWKEWQRVAGMKIQIQNRLDGVEFQEFEPPLYADKHYTISDLGAHFREFVKFPVAIFPEDKSSTYKMLCRYAKRLHYEGMLHIELIIAASIRFNSVKGVDAGIRPTMKRALSAYKFALDHRDEWKVKLNDEERHKILSESALKSAEVRSQNSSYKREHAKSLRTEGLTFSLIAKELEVSDRTVKRWCANV